MQAASQNQLAAYYMGIPVARVNTLVWAISAAVAGFAGVLLAPITFVHVNMGFIGLKAFPAAVIGGFGSVPGAIAGGLIIGVVESLAGFYLPEGFKDVAAYIVVLLVLMVRPHGLFGGQLAEESLTMRFIFKTSYDQDIRLLKHGGQVVLVRPARRSRWPPRRGCPSTTCRSSPSSASTRWSASGLMLLTGYTGQVSLGHAAFLAVGAYTEAVLQAKGVPFGLSLAAAGRPRRPRRHRHRPAGAAPDRHLPRDRHHRLRLHRARGAHALGVGHARQPRHDAALDRLLRRPA